MHDDLHDELEAALLETRAEWERRLEAIQTDRRRSSGPLDQDLEDQAIQLENDETLDALDERGRQELESINAALHRLATGTFGECAECGEPIPPERLRVRPTAEICVGCVADDD